MKGRKKKYSAKKFSETDFIKMLHILIDNIFVVGLSGPISYEMIEFNGG